MLETSNLKLKKPEDNDTLDPSLSLNPNMDIIDNEISQIKDGMKNISTDAAGTSFDNSKNGMTATNVQDAIEENKTSISNLQNELGTNKPTLEANINSIREVL